MYRGDEKSAGICERLVDLDEGIAEWRYRHVRMVERTIGNKPGTGGSRGAAYLQSTIGFTVKDNLPGLRGPAVQKLYAEGAAWLAGSAKPGEPL